MSGRPARSLGRRLAIGLGSLLLAFWLASAGTAVLVIVQELHEVFDSILMETAQIILPDLVERFGDRLGREAVTQPIIVTEATPHDEYITWRLYAGDGRLLMHSHRAAEAPLPPLGFATREDSRVYTEAFPGGRFVLTVAEPAGFRRHTVMPTLVRLLAPLLLLAVAALLLIPSIVRIGFAPLRQVQAEIAARGGTHLRPIERGGLPGELAAMVGAVNQLLRRLRQSLEAERSFSANAAHELRTPVAGALAQAQLLAARLPEGSAARQDAEAMGTVLRGLGARLEKLLQLARAEGGVALKLAPVDLLVPLQLLVEEFASRPGSQDRLRYEDGGLASLIVQADLDALAIALRNLIENALRHGPQDGIVDVEVTAEGEVRVTNDGPVVPPDRLAQLSRRFVSSGGGGAGLGLAIVAAIAEQIGAELHFHSPAPGRADGFQAVFRAARR
jgi:two-component system OmpR family sensor kinase